MQFPGGVGKAQASGFSLEAGLTLGSPAAATGVPDTEHLTWGTLQGGHGDTQGHRTQKHTPHKVTHTCKHAHA